MANKDEVIRHDDGSIFLKFKKRSKPGSKVMRSFECHACMEVKKLEESFTCLAQDGTKGEHTVCFECTKGYVTTVVNSGSHGIHPKGIKCMTCANHIPYEALQRKLKNMGPEFDDKLATILTELAMIRDGRITIKCLGCQVTLDITDYPLGAAIIHCIRCNKCNRELDEDHIGGICPSDMLLAADDVDQRRLHISSMENNRDVCITIKCPKCEVHLDIADYPLGVVIIHCDCCQYDFCRKCLHELDEEHFEGNCPSDVLLAADEDEQHRRRLLMEREIDELKVRKCPNCNVATFREDGCLHVKCIRCNVLWCYYCFHAFRGDDIYAHFCNCTAAQLGGICDICGRHRIFMTNEDIERIEAPNIREIKKRYGFHEEIDENNEENHEDDLDTY